MFLGYNFISKKNKLRYYTLARTYISAGIEDFICIALGRSIKDITDKDIFDISFKIDYLFPELYSHKPRDKKLHESWWSYREGGRDIRISVLNDIISKLQK